MARPKESRLTLWYCTLYGNYLTPSKISIHKKKCTANHLETKIIAERYKEFASKKPKKILKTFEQYKREKLRKNLLLKKHIGPR